MALLCSAIGMAGPARAELVANGNFATGDFTSFNLTGDSSGFYVSGSPGSYAATLTTSSADGFLQQALATVSGQKYTFSFQLSGDGAGPNSISASLGGTTLATIVNVPDLLPNFTTYSYIYTASSASTLLSFDVRDDPGYLYLTSISVVANATVVPEPSSVFMAGIGITLVGVQRRRITRKAA